MVWLAELYRRGYSEENARWVFKQAAQETGHFNSQAFNEDNNAFGMSRVKKRPTTQTGWRMSGDGVNSIGKYESALSSFTDRWLWDKYYGINPKAPHEEYRAAVAAKYHTSPNYANSIDRTSDAVFVEANNALRGAALAFFFNTSLNGDKTI